VTSVIALGRCLLWCRILIDLSRISWFVDVSMEFFGSLFVCCYCIVFYLHGPNFSIIPYIMDQITYLHLYIVIKFFV